MRTSQENIDQDLIQHLRAICGERRVLSHDAIRHMYSRAVHPNEFKRFQLGDYTRSPSVVVLPENTAEVQAIVRLANKVKIPIVPFGGGSGIVEGTALGGSILLDLKKLNHIVIHPENMSVTAGAGTIGWHLEEKLSREGFTLGHFPQSMNSATVGGYVATAATGTFSGKYGKMEDIVIGLEAVLPNGELLSVKPIPRRSAGPHLEALFIGSEGCLGIITQAVLKIHPVPERREWLCCTFHDTPTGLRAIRQLMREGVSPALVRLYDEAEGTARLRKFSIPTNQALLILGFEGPHGLVEWQFIRSQEITSRYGGILQPTAVALDWYRYRFDTSGMLRYNQRPGSVADSLEFATTWENIEGFWSSIRGALLPLCKDVHVHFSHIYENECSAYVIFYADTGKDDPESAMQLYQQCMSAAMDVCLAMEGTISHHHGIGRAKSAWMKEELGDAGWNLLISIKKSLDPNQILNPGVLGIRW